MGDVERQRGLAGATVGAVALLCACGVPPRAKVAAPVAADVLAGPYLILEQPGAVYVAFVARELDDAPVVEWSTPSGAAGGQAALRSDEVWYARLAPLPVDESVSYRVRTARGVGARREFRAGRADGESFRFAVYGETQKGGATHRAVAAALDRERIDFAIHTGDVVHDSDAPAQWRDFFATERGLLARVPLLIAAGDRDAGERELFRRYFLHHVWNENRRYYARDWGDLRIIVVDVNAELAVGAPQYGVIEAALEEGARTGKLMIMVVHYPPYSSAERGWHDVREPIHSLAREHGVELVLSGHSLSYERIEARDGVTYVVTGGGGARSRPISPAPFSAAVSTEPHYVLIDVDGAAGRLVLRALGSDGQTLDDHTVRALEPRSAAAAAPGN